jgi:hypothetical protein
MTTKNRPIGEAGRHGGAVIVTLPRPGRVRAGSPSSRWRLGAGPRGPDRSGLSARPGRHRWSDEPAAGYLADQRPRRDVREDPGPEGERGGGQRGQRLTQPHGLRCESVDHVEVDANPQPETAGHVPRPSSGTQQVKSAVPEWPSATVVPPSRRRSRHVTPFYPVTQDAQQVLSSQVRRAFVRYDPPSPLNCDGGSRPASFDLSQSDSCRSGHLAARLAWITLACRHADERRRLGPRKAAYMVAIIYHKRDGWAPVALACCARRPKGG